MQIAGLQISGRAALAPMAGVADKAFRECCAGFGACYTVGEMVSSKGIFYHDKKSAELMDIGEKERPCAIQLFGDDPEIMAFAAKKAMEFCPDAIDINMGCPAPKVVATGSGSALMKRPALCGEIVKAVKAVVNVPVTVKIRKGWDESTINGLTVAKICEEAGADAVAVHARTRAQMYAPPADWEYIQKVKEALRIPVIGNGDIETAQDAARMLEETGCDMVMVGRGALGNPWIFREISAYLTSGVLLPSPGVYEKAAVMLRHIELLCRYKGEAHGMREARKHVAWYMKGLKGAAAFRREAGTLESLDDLKRLCEKIIKQNR